MRAKRTDQNHAQLMQVMREEGAFVFSLHMVGGGFPDAFVGVVNSKGIGVSGLVEFKTKKGKLNPKQIEFWDNYVGGPIAQISDEEGARRFVRMLRA